MQRRSIALRFDNGVKKQCFRSKIPAIARLGGPNLVGRTRSDSPAPARSRPTRRLLTGELSVKVRITERHIASISAEILGGINMGANEAQNLAAIQRGFEAFAKGDIETLKTLFSPNANWNQAEAGVLRGNYRGVEAIFGVLRSARS